MIEPQTIKASLKSLGASIIGITAAVPIPAFKEIVKERNGLGYFGGMAWLPKTAARRADPEFHLEGAKSLICSGWCYSSDSANPLIARYAQHVDYHQYIMERMKSAWSKLDLKKFRAKFFVDSKPIAEKVYAERAGLGWIGKNSLLINKEYGSFFCLGIIVTDLELIYDSPVESVCGDCEKCIDACPTGAIVSPGVLDCRRCISYLTNEHKGEIPSEMRFLMAGKVKGCDICQEVCPYNESVKPAFLIPRK